MNNPPQAPLISLLLFVSVLGNVRAADDAEQQERRQLFTQRGAVEALFASESQACQARFGVTTCLADARARRNASLKPLQAREEVLDAQQRRARAAAQRERVTARQDEFAASDGRRQVDALMQPVAAPASQSRARPRVPVPPKSNPAEQAASLRAKTGAAEQDAQRNRTQMQTRQRQADEHARDVLERTERRAAQGKKPAAPLPSPTASPAASTASAPVKP